MPKCKKKIRSIASLYIHDFSIRNKSDYIAHQTLYTFKPLWSYMGIWFSTSDGISQHPQPLHRYGIKLSLQPGTQPHVKPACSACTVSMCTQGQHGNYIMHLFCMCFAEYNLLICLLWEMDVYLGSELLVFNYTKIKIHSTHRLVIPCILHKQWYFGRI